MTLGSVHSGFSITEGKARMETNETFETLFPRIPPSRPDGNFADSPRRRSRGVPGLQSAFLALRLVQKSQTVEAAVCTAHGFGNTILTRFLLRRLGITCGSALKAHYVPTSFPAETLSGALQRAVRRRIHGPPHHTDRRHHDPADHQSGH